MASDSEMKRIIISVINPKLRLLEAKIEEIPADAFRTPRTADRLKTILKRRRDDADRMVGVMTPDAFNNAIFILERRIGRPLDWTRRRSWIKRSHPLPEIKELIKEIVDAIESLLPNTPPHPVLKINGEYVGHYYTCKVNKELTFDGSESWDEDGEIVAYHWGLPGPAGSYDEPIVTYAFTMDGWYRVTFGVTDNQTPCEYGETWVEITVEPVD